MKKFYLILLILIIFQSCQTTIKTTVSGNVFYNDNTPAKDYEIGGRINLSPRDFKYNKRTNVDFGNNGEFTFKINKKETSDDKEFTIIFKKQGYETHYEFIDITKEKKINLDTIYLKKIVK